MTSVLEPSPSFHAIDAGLSRKQSFEASALALARCQQALRAPEGKRLTTRAHTLLRSRFTTRPFWVAGRQLFQAALAEATSKADQQLLASYIAECDEFLGDAAGNSDEASGADGGRRTAQAGYLFEGQLGAAEPAGMQGPRPDLLDLLGGTLAQQLTAAVAQREAEQQQQQQQQQGAGGVGPGGPRPSEEGRQQAAQDAQQQAAQLPPDVFEAIERELDAIAVQLMEATAQEVQAARPPTSKKVVAALPKERLSEERLAELGGADLRCPICMDEFGVGDEVLALPCRHVFHPLCVAPWLSDNNTCPTCRHELPTDDWKYESRKTRAAEEEAERQGAANAVSHNEFLYI
ncbi:hypothetical protein D9Q98_003548 [Chlorella vulgaris]|uniref:RING-type E3 ubiquitin transferase n=1 Tax=Chlorella vulgaris TaxID=3077 RepID=A0A9D4YZ47_CHLVU|nr:hypothetical protein D9Q98_003548 [Chlorella vulgaris]